jgi:2-polyprenyl-3-methyl-5-hydroxy-6-metoxy-1,4-benzoquinol methylase
MVELQVVKLMRREASHSEELRHLLAMCVMQARQVFDEVRLLEITPADLDGAASRFDPAVTTLILGQADALVTRRSLEAMRLVLSDGRDIAIASPFHGFAAVAGRPIRSLHDFEQAERVILAAAEDAIEPAVSHLPVALAAPAWLRRVAPDGSVGRLLADSTLLENSSTDGAVGRAGVFFELIDCYGSPREDILSLLPERAHRVLEVGCARGVTAQMVAERLGCPVVGVELNPEVAREAAGRIDEVIIGDVLDVEIEGTFDVIIATDVLEHVDDTHAFLQRMSSLLETGGRLILSVPNVGHYSVVADLACGRWDYVPAGLLCVTHRRFFTRRSLSEALQRAGFSDYDILPQETDLPDHLLGLADLPGADAQSLRTEGFLVACSR